MSALKKVHPILHAIFGTTRSGFIQILRQCWVSWKINPLHFFSSNLACFGQKEHIGKKFLNFWMVGWKFTKFLMSYLKPQISFFFKTLHQSSVPWEITLLYFFSWNLIWFGQKKPIKVQDFRLSSAHVKFHQISTLTGSFFWKYIKFRLKNYWGDTSNDTEEWCKISTKTDLLFHKWQEFGEFWPEHSKVLKFSVWLVAFVPSV